MHANTLVLCDVVSCSDVLLQSASDSRLTTDGCDLNCLLLPVAQPNLHNIIALFEKLIADPLLVADEKECDAVSI